MDKSSVKVAVKGVLTEYLEQKKLRKTPERFAILDAIYSQNQHFTIRELGLWLEENRFPVSIATLYNAINLFMQLKLVECHKLHTTTVYEASYGNGNVIRQICRVCGKEQEVKAMHIFNTLEEIHLHRFRREETAIYIYGTCSNCQARITRMKNKNKKKKI